MLALTQSVATAQSHVERAPSPSRDVIIFITLGIIAGFLACAALWTCRGQQRGPDRTSASVGLCPFWTYSRRKWDRAQLDALKNSSVGVQPSPRTYFHTHRPRPPGEVPPSPPTQMAVAIAVTNEGEELHALQQVQAMAV